MTGWRIGYICAPKEIVSAINELQQYVVMSSSSIAQHAAIAALEHKPIGLAERYQKKRDFAISQLTTLGYEVHGAQGAFYLFVKAPHNLTDIEFVERATNHGLILVPGRAFSAMEGFVRISYGAPMSALRKGMAIMEQISKELAE